MTITATITTLGAYLMLAVHGAALVFIGWRIIISRAISIPSLCIWVGVKTWIIGIPVLMGGLYLVYAVVGSIIAICLQL